MAYSSIIFLYFFLPVFMGVYAICRPKNRSKIIILGSIFFMAWQSPFGIINFLISVLVAYLGGIVINNYQKDKSKAKVILIISIVINVAIFLAFCGSNYNSSDIICRLINRDSNHRLFASFGVGIFTLHSISYCADIYTNKIKADTKFVNVCAYVGFLPVLTCGPILRYDDISNKLNSPAITSENLSDGILKFLRGLAEKVIIANQLGAFWSDILAIEAKNMSMFSAWLGMLIFGFWFYYEFQGYCHMARGFALMLGFSIPKNFDLPLCKNSVSEFFSSFNISLYNWINDYVYVPMTKKCNSKIMETGCMMVATMLLSLWYGFALNFILWGLFLLLVMWFEKYYKIYKYFPVLVRKIIVNFYVLFCWSFFSGKSLYLSFGYIRALFRGGIALDDKMSWHFIKSSGFIIAIAIIFATPLLKYGYKKLSNMKFNFVAIIRAPIILALLLLCTAFLTSETSMNFFQF